MKIFMEQKGLGTVPRNILSCLFKGKLSFLDTSTHGALQKKEMNNWNGPMVKYAWNFDTYRLHQKFWYSITTKTCHFGRYCWSSLTK